VFADSLLGILALASAVLDGDHERDQDRGKAVRWRLFSTGWDVCLEVLLLLETCGAKTVKRPTVMPGLPGRGWSVRFAGRGVW